MNISSNLLTKNHIDFFIDRIRSKKNEIRDWLRSYEKSNDLPLYSSVDIRNAGFKMGVVDTNLFPAGFNNLCEHGVQSSIKYIRNAILKRAAHCKNILIVAEEHTRNTWYLENVRILKQIIESGGFNVKIATFLSVQPSFCENANFVELQTATGNSIKIYCFKKILSAYESGEEQFDLIILNNDLTDGIPEVLKRSRIPIYPSISAGWHSRLKSHHFSYTKDLISEFSKIIDVDPWFFSCFDSVISDVNINLDADRNYLKEAVFHLIEKIKAKYKQHEIDEKPYVLLKSDSGTYGMGVLPIEDPEQIAVLNRKNRNKLYKGKNSQIIDRYLIQEGIPTIYNIDNKVSEACIYQVEHNLVGGFYRSHFSKGDRDNLNSKGVDFSKMCPQSSQYGDCGVKHDINVFDIYRILARIAAIAAHREIKQLESKLKK